MVAAVLHLHEGAGAASKAVDQVRRGFPDRHDVVDQDFFFAFGAERVTPGKHGAGVGPCGGPQLLLIAEHAVDLGHRGKRCGLGLRGTAGDDDAGTRPLAPQLADRLPRLPRRLRGDRAGVDHHGVGEPGRFRLAPDQLQLVGIEPAAEGEDIDAHATAVTGRRPE